MKKVLIVATVVRFLGFEKNDINILQEMGYEVHCATNLHGNVGKTQDIEMVRHHIDFTRSPLSIGNVKAYFQLRKLMKEEQFDLVHCHTPVGGIIARLCAQKYRKKGTVKVIYTAHGFHFFKGAPFKYWLTFFPIEWLCSWMTDVLITINNEDYARAKKCMHAKNVEYIPGVGIEVDKFNHSVSNEKKIEIRQKYNLKQSDFVLLSVGELSVRKNHQIVIKVLAELNIPNIKYVICGQGNQKENLIMLSKRLGVQEQVIFTGFQRNVNELYGVSDMFLFPSKQEGLPVALMEAMACNCKIVCSSIRGNIDLISDYYNGLCVENKECEYVDAIIKLMGRKKEMPADMSRYDIKCINGVMKRIYEDVML